MQITRNTLETTPGPSDWFTGAVYIDAGTRDEYYLELGAAAYRRALADVGFTDVRFDLFDATHMAIEYRYPLSLAYLAERLSP